MTPLSTTAAAPSGALADLWRRPILLLALTMLIWAGHAVVGRLAAGQIGPMTLTCLRWGLAMGPVLYMARGTLARDWPALKARWAYIVPMGACGYTGFNALYYVAAHRTSAINISILQGVVPVLVLLGAHFALKARAGPRQWAGAAITLLGVAVIACQGDVAKFWMMAFNFGDVLMLVAVVVYSIYTLGLARRPDVSPFSFLAALAIVAFLTSIPLAVGEYVLGGFVRPTALGLATLVYAALGPAFLAQMYFVRGVELVGPARAGVFVNLVPIFGALMGVVFLGETFYIHQVAALALVAGGVALAQRP